MEMVLGRYDVDASKDGCCATTTRKPPGGRGEALRTKAEPAIGQQNRRRAQETRLLSVERGSRTTRQVEAGGDVVLSLFTFSEGTNEPLMHINENHCAYGSTRSSFPQHSHNA